MPKSKTKSKVNKSALIRDYRARYPEKSTAELAEMISNEHDVELNSSFVSAVLGKGATTKRRKKKAPSSESTAEATPVKAPAKAVGLVDHLASLKAAALALGKAEAKKIIDLF